MVNGVNNGKKKDGKEQKVEKAAVRPTPPDLLPPDKRPEPDSKKLKTGGK